MILDIIKIAVSPPEKLTKGVLNSIRYLFTLVISIALYRWLFGPWKKGDANEWEIWREWISTGKVLISIFLFVTSYFLTFYLLPLFTIIPLVLLERNWKPTRRIEPKFGQAVIKTLTAFGLIAIDKTTEHVKATQDTYKLIDFLKDLKQGDDEKDSVEDTASYILEIWHLLILFNIFYWLKEHPYHWPLNIALLIMTIVLPFCYVCLKKLYGFLIENDQSLIFLVEAIETSGIIDRVLRLQGYPILTEKRENGIGYERKILYRKIPYLYHHYHIDGDFTPSLLDIVTKTNLPQGKRAIIFTNAHIPPQLVSQVLDLGERLTIIRYNNLEELDATIQDAFPKETPTYHHF
jgi:hypothetical protein